METTFSLDQITGMVVAHQAVFLLSLDLSHGERLNLVTRVEILTFRKVAENLS